MVFDANQNGNYEIGVDAVDNSNLPGFVVISAVPLITPYGIVALIGLLSVVAISTLVRKRRT
jgi:hypothetical protein